MHAEYKITTENVNLNKPFQWQSIFLTAIVIASPFLIINLCMQIQFFVGENMYFCAAVPVLLLCS